MSKKKAKSKRPKDINQLAFAIVAEATGDKPKEKHETPKIKNNNTK